MDEFQTKMVAMLTKLTHDVDDLKIGMGNLSIDVNKLSRTIGNTYACAGLLACIWIAKTWM